MPRYRSRSSSRGASRRTRSFAKSGNRRSVAAASKRRSSRTRTARTGGTIRLVLQMPGAATPPAVPHGFMAAPKPKERKF